MAALPEQQMADFMRDQVTEHACAKGFVIARDRGRGVDIHAREDTE